MYSKLKTFLIFYCVFELCNVTKAARILAAVPTPLYSHQTALRPIWRALADKGHQVVLITCDPMTGGNLPENLKQIDTSFARDILDKYNYSALTTGYSTTSNPFQFLEGIFQVFHEINLRQLEHREVQKLIRNQSEHFDLLMLEVIFPTFLGLKERFNVPVIGLSSMDVVGVIHDLMGNQNHYLLQTDLSLSFLKFDNLFGRALAVSLQFFNNLYIRYSFYRQEDVTVRHIFGGNSKKLEELYQELDMLFINVNHVFHAIRALTPNTIVFGGGSHVENEEKPLPKELQEFFENATIVIYFSLGTSIKTHLLPQERLQIFISTFAALPYKVLWKHEGDLPNKPENVMISSWLPQTQILGHKKTKLFITQCGLQSVEESILHHVPMIALPFMIDQPGNADIVHKKQLGLRLNHETLTTDILKEAIIEVITNETYKLNVKEIAAQFEDVEMPGIEKAIWWTEYVLRHKGAKHLRNPVAKIPFYQYYLLDVLLTFLFISWFGIKVSKMILSKN